MCSFLSLCHPLLVSKGPLLFGIESILQTVLKHQSFLRPAPVNNIFDLSVSEASTNPETHSVSETLNKLQGLVNSTMAVGISDLHSEIVMRGCYVNVEQTHQASGLGPFRKLTRVSLTTNLSLIGKREKCTCHVYVDLTLYTWMEKLFLLVHCNIRAFSQCSCCKGFIKEETVVIKT